MGSLFLARDPAIDRLVAIKLLRRGYDTQSLRERFAREARAAGRLRHPNIVTIFDVGEHDGDPFIAMEFLAGETLADLIRQGARLSLSRRLKLLEELCDGLAYAHRAGLVHRDVKPANLTVDAEGVLKILDFGIVRVTDSGMTHSGVLVGTINYMSPEQVLGTGVDHRSDIFAVGLVAYELLSGRQAFPGTIKDGLLKRIPTADIEPLAGVVPGLDREVVAIVEQALEPDPAARYQELARMRNDLARVRKRVEVEEERAASEAVASAGETAFIAHEPTSPGVVIDAPRASSSSEFIADAERALASGHYRAALTMAGRAAALNPHDRHPSGIVARAEAGLLDRGRAFESSGAVGLPASSAPSRERAGSSAGPQPPTSVGATHVTYLAVGVAVLALIVAGLAMWPQFRAAYGDPRPAQRSEAVSKPAAPPQSPAVEPATPPQNPSDPQAGATHPGGSAPTPRPAPNTAEPQRSARESKSAGSTSSRSSQPPRRQTSTAVQSAPSPPPPAPDPSSTASTPTEPPPTARLPLPETTRALATLPGSTATRLSAPAPPKAADPPGPPASRDPRAEAEQSVRETLRQYEAAWEARNFDALSRVWAMSQEDARTVRESLANASSYEVSIVVDDIEPDASGAAATANCTVTRRFVPRVGRTQAQTNMLTMRIERRSDRWVIVSVRARR